MKSISIFLFLFIAYFELFAAPQDSKNLQTDIIYANISVTQAKDTILAHTNDPWFVILDVRRPSEYEIKHLEKGVNIDYYLTDFATILSTLNKNKTYLIHCASGGRSGQVYTMMQNMNFQKVYNMDYGLNAWSSAGYPTVTTTAPAIGVLCDTIVNFNNTNVNETDSVLLTITNAANDTLSFSGIPNLNETSFSTNFDTNITLLGARDYSFYMYYSPLDILPDSITFNILTNGGSINFIVHGSTLPSTNINQLNTSDFSIFNDINNKQIIINSEELKSKTIYYLYDTAGRLITTSSLSNNNVIDYSNYQNGVYLLQISSTETSKSYKLLIQHSY